MPAVIARKPSNPRERDAWKQGNWEGAPPAKVRYTYCKDGAESLFTIARKLAGQATNDTTLLTYPKDLRWNDIARLNYATDTPGHVNWYLATFNGCKKVAASGFNYDLSAKDAEPWLWIPASSAEAATAVQAKKEEQS